MTSTPNPHPSIHRSVTIKNPHKDGRTIQLLLAHLYLHKKIRPSGRIFKSTIRNFIEDRNLPIPDIDWLIGTLRFHQIIIEETPYTVIFHPMLVHCETLDQVHEFTLMQFNRFSKSLKGDQTDFLTVPRLLDEVQDPDWMSTAFPLLCEWGYRVLDYLQSWLDTNPNNNPSGPHSLTHFRYRQLLTTILRRYSISTSSNHSLLL
jgi:hypothetical protein